MAAKSERPRPSGSSSACALDRADEWVGSPLKLKRGRYVAGVCARRRWSKTKENARLAGLLRRRGSLPTTLAVARLTTAGLTLAFCLAGLGCPLDVARWLMADGH